MDSSQFFTMMTLGGIVLTICSPVIVLGIVALTQKITNKR